jgi:acetyl esterase/lipase
MSNELQVTPETPPAFLWHTDDDTVVPVANSLAFYQALHEAGVPAELHIYEHGRHGLGLAPGVPGVSVWPEQCQAWLKARGLLARAAGGSNSGNP